MEIHELNNFIGTPGSGDYFAIDNGTDTSRISAEELLAPINARIDNIITSPAPSAEEVTDARLGAAVLGSVQYASLGEAIRGQVTVLSDYLAQTDQTARLIIQTGKFWAKNSSGKLIQSNYARTNAVSKIMTRKGDRFRLRTSGTGTAYSYYVVDVNNNVLSNGSASVFDGILEIADEGAAFLAVNYFTDYANPLVLYLITEKDSITQQSIEKIEYDRAAAEFIKVPVPMPIENSAIYDTTGYYGIVSSTSQMAEAEYIPLMKGLKYSVITTKPGLMFNLYFYDENYNFIEPAFPNSSMKYYKIQFENTGYSYMRIGAYLANIQPSDFEHFNIFGFKKSQKKVSFLGDSITAGVGSKMLFHMYLAHDCNCISLNYGVGGTGFVGTVSGSNMQGDGVEGVGSMQISSGGNNILDRVGDIPTDSNLIVVFGGTNDWGGNQSMSAFEANVNGVIDYFQSHAPTAELLFLTPVRRYRNGIDGESENTQGYKLSDYCKAIMDNCANKGVKCIDLYNSSGLNPLNSDNKTALVTDGLHPNYSGHRFIYRRIKDVCKSLISD